MSLVTLALKPTYDFRFLFRWYMHILPRAVLCVCASVVVVVIYATPCVRLCVNSVLPMRRPPNAYLYNDMQPTLINCIT